MANVTSANSVKNYRFTYEVHKDYGNEPVLIIKDLNGNIACDQENVPLVYSVSVITEDMTSNPVSVSESLALKVNAVAQAVFGTDPKLQRLLESSNEVTLKEVTVAKYCPTLIVTGQSNSKKYVENAYITTDVLSKFNDVLNPKNTKESGLTDKQLDEKNGLLNDTELKKQNLMKSVEHANLIYALVCKTVELCKPNESCSEYQGEIELTQVEVNGNHFNRHLQRLDAEIEKIKNSKKFNKEQKIELVHLILNNMKIGLLVDLQKAIQEKLNGVYTIEVSVRKKKKKHIYCTLFSLTEETIRKNKIIYDYLFNRKITKITLNKARINS